VDANSPAWLLRALPKVVKSTSTMLVMIISSSKRMAFILWSEAILINWLITPGNYSKYRGKNNLGKRKIHFAEEISKRIHDAGVRVKRDKDKVTAKIKHIETSFRSAHDFAFTETGAGLKETDEGNFRDIILKKCPWYFDLLPIFQDRASAKPRLTSDDLDSDEEEEVVAALVLSQ
jgi:hypothetical protein